MRIRSFLLFLSRILGCLLTLTCCDANAIKPGKLGRNLIINGEEAPQGRYTYMASLASSGQHRCGGTLIAPDIILTAAHCAGFFEEIQLGRHDLLRDYVYESYVIQDTATHPRFFVHSYVSNDIDHFDFMLVKMYGESGRLPIRINRNDDLPTNFGDQLVVIGWGTVKQEIDNPTDLLRQVSVDYIPNDRCKTIVGETKTGVPVNLAERVIGVTLCAADFVQGEDTCQGDSGGPIMLASRLDNAANDIQVGVTSFGINGCADETFPGFYARLSHAQQWIDETVCSMSNNPPADFRCESPRDHSPDWSGELLKVNIDLRLDALPSQTGWYLMSTNEDGVNATYASRPIFSYRNTFALSSVTETVTIPNNRQYYFVVVDRVGNGMCCNSTLRIYKEDQSAVLLPTVVVGSGFSSKVFPFVLGVPPTPRPTNSPMPSTTNFPSSAPTMTRPFITVVLLFDNYASETGWFLEVLPDDPENGDPELLAVRYPGHYQDKEEGEQVIEVVDLMLPVPGQIRTYRFTMTDNEGDGICCGTGEGSASVYLGLDTLLFRFTDFFVEESRQFTDQSLQPVLDVRPMSDASSISGQGILVALLLLLLSVMFTIYV